MTAGRRLRLTFGALLTLTVVAMGLPGRLMAWPPSSVAGLGVAAGGSVALFTGGLVLRILVVLDRDATRRR